MVFKSIKDQFHKPETLKFKKYIERKRLETGLYVHPKVLEESDVPIVKQEKRHFAMRPSTDCSSSCSMSSDDISVKTPCAQDYYSSFLLCDSKEFK